MIFFVLFFIFFSFAEEKIHKVNDLDKTLDKNELVKKFPAKQGCMSCHYNLESIMPTNSAMMQAIYIEGEFVGDPNGCVVCHGGNPKATTKQEAHQGSPEELKEHGAQNFYPNPGDLAIAEFTCGLCHGIYVDNVKKSLMNTYTGGTAKLLKQWQQNKSNHYAMDSIVDDDLQPNLGTKQYLSYMKKKRTNKNLFPDEVKKIPHPTLAEIEKDPSLIAFAFHQINCQQCHLSSEGGEQQVYQKQRHRSMGCSACHMPYSQDGKYKGNDIMINKQETGHVSFHKLNISKSGGIPLNNCFACHEPSYNGDYQSITYESKQYQNIGKSNQILSFILKGQQTKWNEAKKQNSFFQKYKNDLHHTANNGRGMLCQDCHTTVDTHGDGNLFANAFAQVEIECQDCHGTPNKYPWQLPIGYGDEYGEKLSDKIGRGTAEEILPESTFAKTYPKKDGYLLTARGNPYGNVVKDKEKVLVYTVRGDVLEVPLLKTIKDNNQWKSQKAKIAMENPSHIDKMECYTCHSHSSKTSEKIYRNTISMGKKEKITKQKIIIESTKISKKITLPAVGFNQEGRYSPLLIQNEFILKKEDKIIKKMIYNNNYPKIITEDSMFLPHQPHSVTKIVKDCKECHDE